MKSFKQVITNSAFALLGLTVLSAPAHAINITTTNNGDQLVNTIVGSGITTSNVKYKGAPDATGLFSDGLSSGIGLDKGIILTTGKASLAVGPNTSDSAGQNNGLDGDADLNTLLPIPNTGDASSLEFDFESQTGDLFFNYVFASEEYNEFANSSFNDVFGFFVNGQNIALIPGTTTPVSINNVNGGNPLGQNAKNPEFFVSNDPSDGKPAFDIQYDGFTKVFTAKATGLQKGKNTIKFAIADAGDKSYDSAVFIQAGTFGSLPPAASVPEPASILGLIAVSVGTISLKGRKKTSV